MTQNIIQERQNTDQNENNDQLRPVLVFFKNYEKMKKFRECDEFKQYKDSCLILSENSTHNEKLKLIKDACRLNKITLCTSIFGRGTDFQIIDNRVNKIGGSHVIQAFFSKDISEEVQIKGRTARHGDPGSFSIIANENDFKNDFGKQSVSKLNEERKENDFDIYKWMEEKRNKICETANKMTDKAIQDAKTQHDLTEELIEAVKNQNKEKVLGLLQSFSVQENCDNQSKFGWVKEFVTTTFLRLTSTS